MPIKWDRDDDWAETEIRCIDGSRHAASADEVVTDRRFLVRKSVTPLEMAEHILQQAASGERDLNRLKSSAFERLSAAA